MDVVAQPPRPRAVAALAHDTRGPSPLLVAMGGGLALAVALSLCALLRGHDRAGARDSAAPDEAPALQQVVPRVPDDRGAAPPHEPDQKPAVVPAGEAPAPSLADAGAADDCDTSSFRFRQMVGACFTGFDLCGQSVVVRFDDRGQAADVRFAPEVPQGVATNARETLACVSRRLTKLATRCSRSTTVNYTQRCTLH